MAELAERKLSEIERLTRQLHDTYSSDVMRSDWYPRGEMKCIEHPTQENRLLAPDKALEEILKRIEKLRSESNKGKLLRGLAIVHNLLIQAVDEIERIRKFVPLIDRLYDLLDNQNPQTRKSAAECRRKAIELCFAGLEAPSLKITEEGICKLRKDDVEIEIIDQGSRESSRPIDEPKPEETQRKSYDNSELASLASKLDGIELSGTYVSSLSKTIDSLKKKLDGYDVKSHSVKDQERIVQRAYFILDLVSHSAQLNGIFEQAIENMETVDVKIPSEYVIFLVMVHNVAYPDFPIRFDVANCRLYPG